MSNDQHTLPVYSVPNARWNGWIRFFHWTSVLFLVAAWVLITCHEELDDKNYTYIGLHKAVGVTFLFWVLMRIAMRIKYKSAEPAQVVQAPTLQKLASGVHALLYLVMIAMPVAGFFMSQFANYPVNMFGLFEIPVFVQPNEEMSELLEGLHTELVWTMMLLLAGAHIVAAWYHQLIKKDKTINRMI